jgi:hypothetical protein
MLLAETPASSIVFLDCLKYDPRKYDKVRKKTVMKIRAMFCLTVLAAATPLAIAKLTMAPQSLGHVEATLNFCGDINPKGAAAYKEFGKMLVKEATEEELKKVRASSEYKENYDSVTKQLAEAPKDQALQSCASFLPKE